MTKFEKVQKALMEKTKDTSNWITLSDNIDCRHKGKYVLRNVITNSICEISYKTLDEVIREFNLKI